MTDKISKNTQSYTALAVMLAFIIPLVLAMLLYATRDFWSLTSSPNGELINPPLTLPLQFKERQWHLLLIRPDCIDTACEVQLAKINSIHEATGKDFKRSSNILVTRTSNVKKELLENIQWLELNNITLLEDGLYIMDPDGYIILKYPLDVPAKGVLEDFRHLLKVSQIG